MHPVEPFTDELWICLNCGNLFARWPRCEQCKDDPMMQNHQCEVEGAMVEGDCEPDPILMSNDQEEVS